MMNLKVLFIDDEKDSTELLTSLMEKYFPKAIILNPCHNLTDAIKTINKDEPDVVFLDIKLSNDSGFDLFNFVPNPKFKTVFVSAFRKYALEAFNVQASGYLTKPVSPSQFFKAVNNIIELQKKSTDLSSSETLVVPLKKETLIVQYSSILYLEADDSYCFIYTKNKRIYSSKPLKYFEMKTSE